MAYGNYGGRSYGNSGGYNRGGYNQGGGQGGYAQNTPAAPAQPLDVHAEITKRVDLLLQFKDVIVNEKGIPADEFFMMMPALGGWVTSIILKEEKGK
ncbi:MAG: hypothetical protein II393_01410 [Cytophagales bacterium]|nr:hypothetical protein [Cytophagales bacterium]MBQ5918990.1 hypothetical protein [Lachnospiraceae bacterium]